MKMRKIATGALFAAFTFLATYSVHAQNGAWNFAGVFPDPSVEGHPGNAVSQSMHGIAVDKNDRVWVQPNGGSVTLENGVTVRPLYVFNADGTQASFSPITHFTVDGVADTLKIAQGYGNLTGIGLERDHEGNILATYNNKLYRFNADDGSAMNRYISPVMRTETIPHYFTKPGVTSDGDIVLTFVFPGSPVILLDADFNDLGTVFASKPSEWFNRTIEISADGKKVYVPSYPLHRIFIFESEDGVFGEYALTDSTTLAGMATESMARHPITEEIWFSGGSDTNMPLEDSGYEPFTHYSYNPTTGVITERLTWDFEASPWTGVATESRPRGIAFSNDGNTAYVIGFNASGVPTVQKFTGEGTSLDSDFANIPDGYALAQNYPNPFNPSTQIKFEIADNANVTLTVYDMLGRVVANLVNTRLQAGTHFYNFDAKNLSSGIYLYELKTDNGVRLTNKMTLVK